MTRPRWEWLLVATAALAVSGCSSPTKPKPPSPPPEPVISCPDPQTIQSLDDLSVSVIYGSPTVANGKLPITTGCSPESGSSFPLGVTQVTCTATDALQRASVCTFPVTVKVAPRLSVTRFVAFGDSITSGENGQDSLRSLALPGLLSRTGLYPPPQRYPSVLLQELQARYTVESFTVDNAGCPGESAGPPSRFAPPGTEDSAQRFSDVLSGHGYCPDEPVGGSGPYDVVLMMEGSNDISNDSRTIPPAIANLQKMVKNAKSRGVKPYLATLPPKDPTRCYQSRCAGSTLVQPFNDQLKSMAFSENVPVVDVYDAINSDIGRYIGFDGLHPTVDGYAKIADTFFAAIMKTLEVPTSGTSIQAVGARRVKAPVVRVR